MEPATAIKMAKLAISLGQRFQRLINRPTATFVERRDREQKAWMEGVVHRMQRLLPELQTSVDGLEEKLEAILEDPQLEVVAALYQEDAYKEAIDERRRMLEHATATLIDPTLQIEEKARVERVLRELDPVDVMCLYGLSRVVGERRVRDGKLEAFESEDALRFRLWMEIPSAEGLGSTSCVRFSSKAFGAFSDGTLHERLHITTTGCLVLRVLRSYTASRPPPFEVPGREVPDGSRTAEQARSTLGDLDNQLRSAARTWRFQFDVPKPFERDGALVVPRAADVATIHFAEIPIDVANQIAGTIPDDGEIRRKYFSALTARPMFANLGIEGPWDLLRWVADEVNARWT